MNVAVQFSIGDRACHPPVALSDIGVVVIAAQDGFERSIPADQSRQAFTPATAGKNASTDLRLAEQGMLPAGVAEIARQGQFISTASCPSADGGHADERRFR
jgi:hypothetical protein